MEKERKIGNEFLSLSLVQLIPTLFLKIRKQINKITIQNVIHYEIDNTEDLIFLVNNLLLINLDCSILICHYSLF